LLETVNITTPNVLITIPMSHYCEKARWALERSDVPYREQPHVQAIHRVATRRAGGGLTVPVLVCKGEVLTDSDDILAWANSHAPPNRKLYPRDTDQAAEVRRLEADFNTHLGPDSRRWLYQELRKCRDLAVAYACPGVPAWQRASLRFGYPLLIAIVARVLDVTPATAATSETEVRATFDRVAERLADGRPYLCGDEFSAADLTFSALAAPMLVPLGYGVPLPQPEQLPPHTAKIVREMRVHPAGVHALRMFDTERRRDSSHISSATDAG
jgi:glutathione S-transferase